MAEYRLTSMRVDGEQVPFEHALLSTVDGVDTATWTVEVDGAAMLAPRENQRVRLTMTTDEGTAVEGEAQVTTPGNHDEQTKRYYNVRFTGIGKLQAVAMRT